MPKIRTRKSVAKRVKKTGTGKFLRMKMFSGCTHIRSNKSKKRVRSFRKSTVTHHTDHKRICKLIPYA
ncbi:MAG: 50S ribosomal protein L35 [Candidatus Eremiobacteraeota bacterium]|nr:50S ribosomal protein L35 [Candidatus Eremiobacteraeota bacterium]